MCSRFPLFIHTHHTYLAPTVYAHILFCDSRFFTSPQGLMPGSISVFRSQLYIIFIPLPAPLLFMGLLNLSCIFMYEISSPLSQIMTQNSFPVWPVSISLLPRVHKSSFIHKLSYQIFSLATGSNFHRFHPCHPQ